MLFSTVATAIFCAFIYVSVIAVPKYTSDVRMAFQVRSQSVLNLESVISGLSADQATINTELGVLTSRRLMEQLVIAEGLVDDPEFNTRIREISPFSVRGIRGALRSLWPPKSEPMDSPSAEQVIRATANRLRNAISVEADRNSFLFSISATTEDPVKSARIADALARLYLQDQVAVKFDAVGHAVDWLSIKVRELEEEAQARQEAIRSLRSSTTLISAEALEALTLRVKDVREREASLESQILGAEAEIMRLSTLMEAGEFATLLETGGASPRSNTSAEEQARALMGTRFAVLERQKGQLAALQTSLALLEGQVTEQAEDLDRLNQLEDEAEATRLLHATFLSRLKETAVQIGMQTADSRILSDAAPGRKVAPRGSLILALAVILGLMGGAGFIWFQQVGVTGFRSALDLEASTGLTILGQVPRLPIVDRAALPGYLRDNPTAAGVEAVRNIRTSLLLSRQDKHPQVITVTSSIPGEGKTTLSLGLAHNLAGLGRRVLLIEGDIRRRTLDEYFDVRPGAGLLSALRGETELGQAVFSSEFPSFDVLVGGDGDERNGDLFSSRNFGALIAQARGIYDHVVIDTPPVLVVPEARVIAGHGDAVVYAVLWNRTTPVQLREGMRQFQSVDIPLAGLVLSNVDPKGMRRYGYSSQSGAYSNYGAPYYDL